MHDVQLNKLQNELGLNKNSTFEDCLKQIRLDRMTLKAISKGDDKPESLAHFALDYFQTFHPRLAC